MKRFVVILVSVFCLLSSSFGATRTSTATGNFSAGATWVGGVAPVDGDAFVIANTHVVTFDMDQSAWAGMAASTINAGGTLIASTTAGAYVLKMNADLTVNGTLQAGTSEAVPYPSTCTFTINFSNTAHSIECGATGSRKLYCTQPTHKYVTSTAQAVSAQKNIVVDTDVSAEWVIGATVCIVDSTPLDVQYSTISNIVGTTITINDNSDSNMEIGSLVVVVTRNIKISNVAASDYAITYAAGAGSGDYIGAEISNCYRGVYRGSTFEFAGTTNLLTTAPIALYQPNLVTLSSIITGTSSGSSFGLYFPTSPIISGVVAGWTYGCSYAYAPSINSLIFGNSYGVYQNVSPVLTENALINYCTFGLEQNSGGISYADITNCQRGINFGSGMVFANCSFSGNSTADVFAFGSGKWFNVSFGSATEFASYNTTYRHLSDFAESFDHDQVVNAYKAWCLGGIVTSQTVSPPSGYTIFYDHEVESAIYPCFRQYLTTVQPGTAIEVSAVIRNTDGIDVSATSPIDLRPRLEIIDVFADPLVDSTQTALDSAPIAVSDGTNTDWQSVNVIWANQGDSPRQVYVRIICYSHDASTHTIDEAWSVADYQDQIAAIYNKLPTNYIMGSSVKTDKDDEIDAIKAYAQEWDPNFTAILGDTNELQTDWTNGGRLDLLIDGIKAVTDIMEAVNSTVQTPNDANNFIIANTGDINDVNDAYTGMTVYVKDLTTNDWESRLIEFWQTGREITVDTDFTFTPAAGDIVIIWGTSYFPPRVYNEFPLQKETTTEIVNRRATVTPTGTTGGTKTLDSEGNDP